MTSLEKIIALLHNSPVCIESMFFIPVVFAGRYRLTLFFWHVPNPAVGKLDGDQSHPAAADCENNFFGPGFE